MKHISLLVLLVIFPLCACEESDPANYYEGEEVVDLFNRQLPIDRFARVDSTEWVYHMPVEGIVAITGPEAVKRRLQQMALISWKPKGGKIPSCYGVYSSGTSYSGVPYSLAIKTDTYVGTQISIYSFLTAVDNPMSVLYTENLSKPPYNGFDCAPYYGSTCSNSVMYALGIDTPFYTYMIPSLSGINKPQAQSPTDVEPYDILLKSGHVVLVYEVSRGADGQLHKVRIFETTRYQCRDTWFRDFAADEFKAWWEKEKYVRYQYKYLNEVTYTPSLLVPVEGESGITNYRPLDVCTSLGDGVSYLRGEDVKITPLIRGYKTIVVFKDEKFYSEVPIRYPTTVLPNLPCGDYKVRLSDAEGYYSSHYTHFEVIDAQVAGTKGVTIRITFASEHASPRYVCVCDADHNPYGYYRFTDSDRNQGFFEMPCVQGERTTHFKVFFKGKYNTISTELRSF